MSTQGWSIHTSGGANLCPEGDFATVTGWTFGTGWANGTGYAQATAATGDLSRTIEAITAGRWYRLTVTISNRTAGSVTPKVNGQALTARSSNGTFTQDFKATATGTSLVFTGAGATLRVDDVKVEELDTIDFLEPPPVGTGNISVQEIGSGSLNATAVWALGAWNGAYGYPAEVEFYADRLWFAASKVQPQTVWASRTGDYSFFGKSTPILDDDAITATFNARQLNTIHDLVPKQHLLALTSGGVWKVGGTDDDALTPGSVSAKPQPSAGAGTLPALDVGETAVYCTHKGGEVRDLTFTFEADGYAGSDLTAFASHLIKEHPITEWAWCAVPHAAVVSVRSDGVLLTMTYKREHQVVAWAWHDTAGDAFESVCTIPEGDGHAVYVVVNRGGRRYVERMRTNNACMVDSALHYSGAPADTMSGLGHLEGRTVRLFGDDYDFGEQVVTGGQVQFPQEVSTATVGLPFVAQFESLPMTLVGQAPVGANAKIIREVGIYVQDGREVAIGPDFETLERRTLRDSSELESPAPRKTQWVDVPVHGAWQSTPRVCVQVDGFGLAILALEPRANIGR